jgi:hypothetical protein
LIVCQGRAESTSVAAAKIRQFKGRWESWFGFWQGSATVPHIAASIAGGTAGLALSHAFEAAYITQTVVRPITSALQTGLNKVAQLGNAGIGGNGEATGWVKAMDFGRQTQQLGNLAPFSLRP